MIRVFGMVALAAVVAIPLSFLVSMLLTPVLWRLEPVVGIELAGHSGPADWIIAAVFGLFTLVLSIILLLRTRAPARVEPPPDTLAPRGRS